ncbi:N-acetyltransferase [Octadecabacter sp. G9-8]|uniref:N-acetyltransferase n=1 Tax=Octadecabacter dasysiphoniae TaxID=2909341 RepID=A0ABS9D0T1_9RHOB|nr:N-acetyltransferase [Octadecabacter dasysiphoniae]MCF2872235.1 N-acetyltransferase [Octadecabacter dasysiphoniae]
MKWNIRQEKAGDEAAIAEVTRAAFAGKAYADGDEDELPAKLRDTGALVLSLVAVQGTKVIGHVALSPARIGGTKCLGLGPVSVKPDVQGKGIGSALVNHAVAVAGAYGRGGVVLMGDPAFYGRLGFVSEGGTTYNGKPSKHLQILGFEDTPSGDATFHSAFSE